MHRIPRLDGRTSQSEFVRWSLASAYVMFAIAGLLLALSSNIPEVYGTSGVVMAILLVVGGSLSAFGSATRQWAGEFIGTPLLAIGLTVLGLKVWLVSYPSHPYEAAANLILLVAVSTVCLARWRMVLAVYRFVHAAALSAKRLAGDI